MAKFRRNRFSYSNTPKHAQNWFLGHFLIFSFFVVHFFQNFEPKIWLFIYQILDEISQMTDICHKSTQNFQLSKLTKNARSNRVKDVLCQQKKLLGAVCVEERKYFPIFVILPHSQDLNPLDRPQTLKYICHRLLNLRKPSFPSF